MVDSDAVIDIAEYSSAIRRRWPIAIVVTIVGAALGMLALSFQTSEFEAEAQVEVRPLVIAGDDPNLDASRQVNLETEQIIANSQRVVERALALLEVAEADRPDDALSVDLDDPEVEARAAEITIDPDRARAVRQQIDVSAPNDSQILVFTVTAMRSSQAQRLAQVTAHAYLDFRRDEGLTATNVARQQLIEREVELLAELDELATQIGAAGENEVRVQALGYREISKREELGGIGTKLANIDSISIDPGTVLNDAGLPKSTTGLPSLAGPLFGALLGLVAGLGLIFFLDRRDDRVRSASDVAAMGLSVLGTVPMKDGGRFRREEGPVIADVNSQAGEAYRRAQGSVIFNLDQQDKSTLLVTGTNNPQSASTVAANLATAAARSGRRTLLVAADLRRPSLHERFGVSNDVGLTDVLSGKVKLGDAIQTIPDVNNLLMLPAGNPVDSPARLLQSHGLGRLVTSARKEFDLVVFESPPILQVADAVDLARLCEGAVLVIESGRATRSGIADSVEQLRLVGADVVGTIMADAASMS